MPSDRGHRTGRTELLTAEELVAERRIIEASQRDASRFATLYERYFDRVYAFALTRTGSRSAAEDVTSETFRRALQSLSRFQWRDIPFSAWLFRIAANAASDLRRRDAREVVVNSLPDESAESWEDRFIDVEQRAQLFKLVERLPRDQRRVIAMRFAEEKTGQEIAQAMGRSLGAVKALQARALRSLRKWVGESDE